MYYLNQLCLFKVAKSEARIRPLFQIQSHRINEYEYFKSQFSILQTYTHTHTHIHTQIHTHTYTHIYTHIRIIHTCIHTHIHTIHTHLNKHINAYTHLNADSQHSSPIWGTIVSSQPCIDVALQFSLSEVQVVEILYQQQHNGVEY